MRDFYKDQRKLEVRVGIIALLCLVILIIGYAWLRNTLQLRKMTEIKIKFESAQGLEVGDKVTVNGMETGRVTKISQLEDGVLIISQLKLNFPIREGAKYIIQDSNLMGGKQLEIINSGTGNPIAHNSIQNGENSFGMTALLGSAATTMNQLNQLLSEMNKPEGFFSQVKETFSETKETFSKVNDTLDSTKGNLNSAMEQLAQSSKQLHDILVQAKPGLNKAIELTPDLMSKASATLDSLQAASNSLKLLMNELSDGTGSLPSLINDEQLYQNLLKSSQKLDSLLIDVKKNPGRYFKVRLF